ncbi:MAG: cupin domain-containing protein [Bryobacteraceae bacterium]|nr:cupin domain-containing protein [Bryobacteraceae bacterium]
MRNEQQSTCAIVSSAETYRGRQGLEYFNGISTETAGSKGLCMHMVTIPPLARAKPHLHERHETAIYVLSGEAAMWYGEGLREHLVVKAGDYLYIPANMPHLPYNPSDSVSCVGLLARTDPNEQESVVLLEVADPGVGPRPD